MAAEKKERGGGTDFGGRCGQDSGRDYRGKYKSNASSQSVEDSPTSYIIGIQSKFKLSFFDCSYIFFSFRTPKSKNKNKTSAPPSSHLVIGR
jgi:hypothetical protein